MGLFLSLSLDLSLTLTSFLLSRLSIRHTHGLTFKESDQASAINLAWFLSHFYFVFGGVKIRTHDLTIVSLFLSTTFISIYNFTAKLHTIGLQLRQQIRPIGSTSFFHCGAKFAFVLFQTLLLENNFYILYYLYIIYIFYYITKVLF